MCSSLGFSPHTQAGCARFGSEGEEDTFVTSVVELLCQRLEDGAAEEI